MKNTIKRKRGRPVKVERLDFFEGLQPCRVRVGDTVRRIDGPGATIYRVREVRRLRQRIECDLVDPSGRTFVVMVSGSAYRSKLSGQWIHPERLLKVEG